MSEPVRIEPERLLAQTAWVRRLALSLSRDEASADDLAQDAFAAALRSPPREVQSEGALRAWFTTVTRNLAIHRARGDSRRSRRESEAARPELERSQERLRELEELRGELVQHVLALPEESQQVVLLSFFEELDSAEIARRLGVPDSTIRNRLRRALVELRDRLERKHGSEWRNLCLFFVPVTGAKVAAGGAAAALFVVGNGWMLAAALVLLASSSWFALQKREADLALSLPVEARAEPAPALVEPKADANAGAASERTLVPTAATAPATLFCQGAILSSAGGPVERAHIRCRDEQHVQVAVDEYAKGWYALGALPPGRYTLEAEAERFKKCSFELALDGTSNPARVDLVLEPTAFVQVRFLDEKGERIKSGEPGHSLEREAGLEVIATKEKPASSASAADRHYAWREIGRWFSAADSFEPQAFIDSGSAGAIEITGELPCFVSLVLRGRVVDSRPVARTGEMLDFTVDAAALQKERASVRVRFVDARTQAPLADLAVQLRPPWRSGHPVKTDAQGSVSFENQPLIPLVLDYRELQRSVELHAGDDNDLGTIAVPAQRTLRVRIVDEAGKPVEGQVVWIPLGSSLSARDFSWHHSWFAAAGKTVEVQAIDARLRVLATPQYGRGPWTSNGAIVEAGSEPVELVLQAVRGVEVEIAWQEKPEGNRDLLFRAPDGEPCKRSYAWGEGVDTLRLVPGEYVVEAWQGDRRIATQKITVRSDTRRIELGI